MNNAVLLYNDVRNSPRNDDISELSYKVQPTINLKIVFSAVNEILKAIFVLFICMLEYNGQLFIYFI